MLDFIEDDGEVLPGISVWRTGGHTMHHQLIMIESGGRTAVFAADLMPTTAHIDAPWIMGYDLYPMDTLLYKKRFVREAIDREYVIFFEHDPAIAAGIIREKDGRRWVDPFVENSVMADLILTSTFPNFNYHVFQSRSASSAAAACTTWRS